MEAPVASPSCEPRSCQAGSAAAAASAAVPPRWLGQPTLVSHGRLHYAAFEGDGQQYSLGDSVYLRPTQPGLLPFIARLESLHEEQGDSSRWATVRWYYRPTELDVGHEVGVEANEVFFSDDVATHPLGAVCGKCEVLTPAQADRRPSSSAAHKDLDVFVCSRKYIPGEGRVVPLDQGVAGVNLAAALQERPFSVLNGKLVQRSPTAAGEAEQEPRPKRVRGNSGAAAMPLPVVPHAGPGEDAAGESQGSDRQQKGQQGQPQRSKRRRLVREAYTPEPFRSAADAAVAAGGGGAGAPPPAGAAAGGVPAPAAPPQHSSEGRDDDGSGGQPLSTSNATGGSLRSQGTAGGSSQRGCSKQGKPMTGRWSNERYESARQTLAAIMRQLGATSASRAMLRPLVREEARRSVGDTGLLDHLLKHTADHVVSPGEERLRRRHNPEGQMVYWLQSPAEAEQEEEALREEMETLSSELREVKEARRVLHAVRDEAAQAIQAVSGLKKHPEELVKALTAAVQGQGSSHPQAAPPAAPTASPFTLPTPAGSPTPAAEGSLEAGGGAGAHAAQEPAGDSVELLEKVQAAETLSHALLARLQHGEDQLAQGEATRLLTLQLVAQLAGLTDAMRGVGSRCRELERQMDALKAEGQRRHDAAAASQAVITSLREEAAAGQRRMTALEADVMAMRAGLTVLAASMHDQPALRAALELAAAGASTSPFPDTRQPGASAQSPAGSEHPASAGPAAAPADEKREGGTGQGGAAVNPGAAADSGAAGPPSGRRKTPSPAAQQQQQQASPFAAPADLPGPAAGTGAFRGAGNALPPLAPGSGFRAGPQLRPHAGAFRPVGRPLPPLDQSAFNVPAGLTLPLQALQQHRPLQLLAAGALGRPSHPVSATQVKDQLAAAVAMAAAAAAARAPRQAIPAAASQLLPQEPAASQQQRQQPQPGPGPQPQQALQQQQQPSPRPRQLLMLPDPLFAQFFTQPVNSSVSSWSAGLQVASRPPTGAGGLPADEAVSAGDQRRQPAAGAPQGDDMAGDLPPRSAARD